MGLRQPTELLVRRSVQERLGRYVATGLAVVLGVALAVGSLVLTDTLRALLRMQEATRPEVVARLADTCGMRTFGASRGRSLAFLSRVPIAQHQWVRPRWSQHAFLEIVPEGVPTRIFGVHLSAVHAAWTEARRVRELRSLLETVRAHETAHHLLIGDFNTIAPNERLDVAKLPRRLRLLVWLSGGRIRWQTIAIMLGAGYADAFRSLHPADDGLTFPTWGAHVRLDYAFVPDRFRSSIRACEVIRDGDVARGSDHYPLHIELELP